MQNLVLQHIAQVFVSILHM